MFGFKEFSLFVSLYELLLKKSKPTTTNLSKFYGNLVGVSRQNPSITKVFSNSFSSSSPKKGLEEFFDRTPVTEALQFGRSWSAAELRLKSTLDLHKLWYILLKERNLLLTHRWDAYREWKKVKNGNERYKAVRQAMARIKLIVEERDNALKEPPSRKKIVKKKLYVKSSRQKRLPFVLRRLKKIRRKYIQTKVKMNSK